MLDGCVGTGKKLPEPTGLGDVDVAILRQLLSHRGKDLRGAGRVAPHRPTQRGEPQMQIFIRHHARHLMLGGGLLGPDQLLLVGCSARRVAAAGEQERI